MNRIINYSIGALLALSVASCGRSSRISSDADDHAQAVALTAEYSPQEVAAQLIEWMENEPPESNAFAREITREIVSVYDSTDNYASRHFAFALDSIRSRLSPERLARVYTVAVKPARLGAMMSAPDADTSLVIHIREALSCDSTALNAFNKSYRR